MNIDEAIDATVIGAGPAGLTTALYLRRFRRRVVVLDAGASRAQWIDRSHNFPGFPAGVAGSELLQSMRAQLAQVHGAVTDGPVLLLRPARAGTGFEVELADRRLQTRHVVLATGVVDVMPPLPGLTALRHLGLLRHCPICDAHEYIGKRIGVIGAGARAAREALFLAHYSDRVALFEWPAMEPLDAELVDSLRNAGVRRHTCVVDEVLSPVRDVVVVRTADGVSHAVDVAYAAFGARPQSDLLRALGAELDDEGAVRVNAHCATSVDGVYAVGDVVSALNQLTVAVGHGACAATAIHNRLREAGAGAARAAPPPGVHCSDWE